mgnify:CR=1 FL=1|jgi:hypothetical protein
MLGVFDESGRLVEWYADPSGRSPWLSEVELFRDSLVMGSWYNSYLTVARPPDAQAPPLSPPPRETYWGGAAVALLSAATIYGGFA